MKLRKLSLVLAATLAISGCLSGCGSEKEQEISKQTESSVVKQEQSVASAEVESNVSEAPELEEKTIQIWLMGAGKQKDSDKVWEAFNEMLQEYVPNTTVEFSVLAKAEYKEKFNQMLASGEAVDLAWVGNWITGLQTDNIRNGDFLPVDDLLDQYGQGIVEKLGDKGLDMHRYSDGKLYYLYSWQGLFAKRQGFQVPTELAELAGDTWLEDTQKIVTETYNTFPEAMDLDNLQKVYDQFDIYFSALKDAGKLYSGMHPDAFFHWGFATNTGVDCNATSNWVGTEAGDDEFKVVDIVATDAFRLSAKNHAEFYKKGYIRSDIASMDVSQLTTVTDATYTPNTVVLKTHNDYIDTAAGLSKVAGTDISVIRIQTDGQLASGIATSVAFPYCADEPERAMMVLNAIYTVPELYQLLVYGIEGEHWTDNGDGTVTRLGGVNAEDSYGIYNWIIGTCDNSLVTQDDTPGYYQKLREAEETATVNKMSDFIFDATPVESIKTAITAIDKEYGDIIYCGYAGDDWEKILDEWIAERKAAGIDKYIAEKQKQLDAYLAEKNITSYADTLVQ